jgi:hypothetical protein
VIILAALLIVAIIAFWGMRRQLREITGLLLQARAHAQSASDEATAIRDILDKPDGDPGGRPEKRATHSGAWDRNHRGTPPS